MNVSEAATDMTTALARALHQAGLPSDTIEMTMHDVASTLGMSLQVNALPTSLTIAAGPPAMQHVYIFRLEPGRLHLRKLALLNEVIFGIRDGTLDPIEALTRISTIDAVMNPDPPWLTVAAYALLSTGAAMLLGGGSNEISVSAIIGVTIGSIAALAQRSTRVDRVFEVLAAFIATVILGLFERFVGSVALYVALVAGVVQILPGFTLTTALNELANRQLVAGTARLGSVALTLLSLGSGFALGLAVSGESLLWGETVAPIHTNLVFSTLAAPTMAIAIAILLHARWRDFGWIFGACAVTIGLQRFFPLIGFTQITPFLTAFVIGSAGNLLARFLHVPQSIVLVPGLLVLVPGSLSYESILYIFQSDTNDAVTLLTRALLAAVLIVSGFLLSQLVFPAETNPRHV